MQIKILKSGLLSTVQDLGRMDFLSQAVPLSGAMDRVSARLANITIGNKETDAVIEFTYGNAEFKCETDVLMSYTGIGATFTANGNDLPLARPIFLPSGTVIAL